MIGVSVHGRPRIGIIHKPYLSADVDLSKTYLGSIETGLFTSEYNCHYTEDDDARLVTRNFQYVEPFAQHPILDAGDYHLHIAATLNRFRAVESILQRLKPSVEMRIGGAGNKCLHILDNKACILVHNVRSMKYWDVCAVEALIRGRFGIVTDKDQKFV